jgi:hypothetical protein
VEDFEKAKALNPLVDPRLERLLAQAREHAGE